MIYKGFNHPLGDAGFRWISQRSTDPRGFLWSVCIQLGSSWNVLDVGTQLLEGNPFLRFLAFFFRAFWLSAWSSKLAKKKLLNMSRKFRKFRSVPVALHAASELLRGPCRDGPEVSQFGSDPRERWMVIKMGLPILGSHSFGGLSHFCQGF